MNPQDWFFKQFRGDWPEGRRDAPMRMVYKTNMQLRNIISNTGHNIFQIDESYVQICNDVWGKFVRCSVRIKPVFHFNRIVSYRIAFSFVSKSLVPHYTVQETKKYATFWYDWSGKLKNLLVNSVARLYYNVHVLKRVVKIGYFFPCMEWTKMIELIFSKYIYSMSGQRGVATV